MKSVEVCSFTKLNGTTRSMGRNICYKMGIKYVQWDTRRAKYESKCITVFYIETNIINEIILISLLSIYKSKDNLLLLYICK